MFLGGGHDLSLLHSAEHKTHTRILLVSNVRKGVENSSDLKIVVESVWVILGISVLKSECAVP